MRKYILEYVVDADRRLEHYEGHSFEYPEGSGYRVPYEVWANPPFFMMQRAMDTASEEEVRGMYGIKNLAAKLWAREHRAQRWQRLGRVITMLMRAKSE